MVDFEQARAQMLESQLRAGGITDSAILAQMRRVPRELFVPAERRALAYADDIQWFDGTGPRRFMAAPVTLAKLLKLGDIEATHSVLDVGTATGYSTAVVAGLCASVCGWEPDEALASTARQNLATLVIGNAEIVSGGLDSIANGQFDVVLVQGAMDQVPDRLLSAVSDGGRLVALIRKGRVCVAHVFTRAGGQIKARAEFNAFLPALFPAVSKEEFVF